MKYAIGQNGRLRLVLLTLCLHPVVSMRKSVLQWMALDIFLFGTESFHNLSSDRDINPIQLENSYCPDILTVLVGWPADPYLCSRCVHAFQQLP